ncbi:MAG: DUF72 domain-containing protein [Acidobacteriota bacterium]
MPGLFDEIPERRLQLAERLRELALRNVWIGTSSWKYPGWLGQIYTPERYRTRGKFSQKKFDETCLAEFAETFHAVCGDFAFYQFPSPEYWAKLFLGSPANLHFAFKVPEHITVKTWPGHARYGQRAGLENEHFLDAQLFEAAFTRVLDPHRARVSVLIFEFGTFSKGQFAGVHEFIDRLDRFLSSLPPDWRYAVEIRNAEYLEPEYLQCLRRHNVAHVFNSWTRMPELTTQLAIDGIQTAEFTVTRALLRPGRSYEHAVQRFAPYEKVQEPHESVREALREIVRQGEATRKGTFVYVNNRLEGNAPGTIEAILDLDGEGK